MMILRNFAWCILVCTNLMVQNLAWAETRVNVVGLFNGKAVLVINGNKPTTLSAGQSSAEGIKLLSADSNKAVLEIEGKRKELGMGSAFSAVIDPAAAAGSVILYANTAGHYLTDGQVNGVTLKFLVDTGATVIAMNSGDAKYAGIDYKKGKKIQMQTASGIADAYYVSINTLKLGGILLHQVDAVVLEGGYPQVVLLGMSALNRMEIKREGMVLTLTRKY